MSQGNAKGTILLGIVKYLRHHRERAQAVVPSRLQHYLNTRILATAWYPEEDYLDLMRAVVQLRPRSQPDLDPFEEAARAEAPTQYGGPYKVMIQGGNPGRTLSKFVAIWGLAHDTGEAEVKLPSSNQAIISLEGYALKDEDACRSTQGSMWGVVDLAGGRDIVIKHSQCAARGDQCCEWKVSWK